MRAYTLVSRKALRDRPPTGHALALVHLCGDNRDRPQKRDDDFVRRVS
jgi:hypothetical protein